MPLPHSLIRLLAFSYLFSVAAASAAPSKVAGDLFQIAAGATLPPNSDPSRVLRFGSDRFAGQASHPSFSPDGKLIVAKLAHNATAIFDAVTGRRIVTLKSSLQTAFLTNDRLVQLQFKGIEIIQRDGTLVRTISVDQPQRFMLSHNGKRMAVAEGMINSQTPNAAPPSITLWNTETGEQIANLGPLAARTMPMPGQQNFFAHLVSRIMVYDGKDTLLTVAADGAVKLWNMNDGQPRPCANVIVDPFVTLELSPDDKTILLSDEVPRQIDLTTGIVSPPPHSFPPMTVSSYESVSARTAAARSTTHALSDAPLTAIIPNSIPANARYPMMRSRYPAGTINYSPDGTELLSLRPTELLRWSLQTHQDLPPIRLINPDEGLDFSPDNARIIAVQLGRLKMFDARGGLPIGPLTAPDEEVDRVCISGDGSNLFAATSDGSLYRFDLATGRPLAWRQPSDSDSMVPRIKALALAGGGQSLITVTAHDEFQRSDPTTLAPTAPATQLPDSLLNSGSLTFSSDGSLLAGSRSDQIAVLATSGILHSPTSEPDDARVIHGFAGYAPMAFSHNNHLLAVAETEKFIRFFSLESSAEPLTPDLIFPKENAAVDHATALLSDVFQPFDLHFTPDARTLLGMSHDGPAAFDVKRRTVRWFNRIDYADLFGLFDVSDDGRLLAYGNASKSKITILDTDAGQPIAELTDADAGMTLLRFIPGTTRLLVVDGTLFNIYDWSMAIVQDETAHDPNDPADTSPPAAYRKLFAEMKRPEDIYQQAEALSNAVAHAQGKTEIQNWIAGLSSPDPAVRERSHHSLERAGITAAMDVRQALDRTPPGEAHDRLEALNDLFGSDEPTTVESSPESLPEEPAAPQHRRDARLIEALDWLHSGEAVVRLQQIAAAGEPDEALLARIALSHQPRR